MTFMMWELYSRSDDDHQKRKIPDELCNSQWRNDFKRSKDRATTKERWRPESVQIGLDPIINEERKIPTQLTAYKHHKGNPLKPILIIEVASAGEDRNRDG